MLSIALAVESLKMKKSRPSFEQHTDMLEVYFSAVESKMHGKVHRIEKKATDLFTEVQSRGTHRQCQDFPQDAG